MGTMLLRHLTFSPSLLYRATSSVCVTIIVGHLSLGFVQCHKVCSAYRNGIQRGETELTFFPIVWGLEKHWTPHQDNWLLARKCPPPACRQEAFWYSFRANESMTPWEVNRCNC
ncbi:hypothetical protein EDB19DRAFT_1704525 [Suillus lakei]|nr:hypothetical protein EDB19DRAFT_1704525 [Suillus lakei]